LKTKPISFLIKRIYIYTLTTAILLLTGFSALANAQLLPADTAEGNDSVYVERQQLSDSIISYADDYLGVKYRRGGKCSTGFDCSGFVRHVFKKFGYTTPASSSAIKTVGVEVKKDSARPGDIIYFTGRNAKTKKPGHVGIVTEVKDGTIYFIHASVNLGISYSNNQTVYYKKRYLGIRRVLNY
jgi:cell wall-associated NlpC family hydrolase